MIAFVAEHPVGMLWLFAAVCGWSVLLVIGCVALWVHGKSVGKVLLEREEEISSQHTLSEQYRSRAETAEASLQDAKDRITRTTAVLDRKTAECIRLDNYLEGLFAAVQMAREKRVGVRNFRPFIETLAMWGAKEHSSGSELRRDRLVDLALMMACEEQFVDDELLARFPPGLIERAVRLKIKALQQYGHSGDRIIDHALALEAAK